MIGAIAAGVPLRLMGAACTHSMGGGKKPGSSASEGGWIATGAKSCGACEALGAVGILEFWAVAVLSRVDRSLSPATSADRRRILEALADGGGLIVLDQLPGDGPEALEYAREHRWEGVVAKRR